jgi:hypothetical protein
VYHIRLDSTILSWQRLLNAPVYFRLLLVRDFDKIPSHLLRGRIKTVEDSETSLLIVVLVGSLSSPGPMRGLHMRSLPGLYKWLIDRPSYMFMTASDERLSAEKPVRFRYAWLGLMGLSVLTGLMLIGVWIVVWRTFMDWDRLSRPAGITAMVLLAWPMRRALVSIGPSLRFRDRANQMAAAAAVAVLVGVGFMSLVERYPCAYEYSMPGPIAWIRPELSIFRVLLLMGIWGAWSMLIAVQFNRPDGITDPITRRFARGCGPLAAATCMVLPLAGTIVFFHYMGQTGQLVITAGTIATGIISGPILCRIGGGMTRGALLAGNLITQIVFLMLSTIWL